MTISADLEPAPVRGNPALLERMIGNLIDNGIRHNEPGGYLSVSTVSDEQHACVVVRNGGAVIDPELTASLAEPFRRLNRSGGGFGLGLSIVRSVAEAHGGVATIAALPGGGLEVRVELPRDQGVPGPGGLRRQRTLTKS